MNLKRLLRHWLATSWALRRAFDSSALASIEQAIEQAERAHGGEIRFAVEKSLDAAGVLRGVSPRERALQVFAQLGVWDTQANNGVLIYLLWADRDVEIVADRGFNTRVTSQEWSAICERMEQLFGAGRAGEAVLEGIRAVSALIARHYPTSDGDEQPNRPVLL